LFFYFALEIYKNINYFIYKISTHHKTIIIGIKILFNRSLNLHMIKIKLC